MTVDNKVALVDGYVDIGGKNKTRKRKKKNNGMWKIANCESFSDNLMKQLSEQNTS